MEVPVMNEVEAQVNVETFGPHTTQAVRGVNKGVMVHLGGRAYQREQLKTNQEGEEKKKKS